jgi:hypothetical protein
MESHRTRVFMENLPRRACAVPAQNAVYSFFHVSAVVNPADVFFSPSIPCFVGAVSHGPEHAGGFQWRGDLASPTTFFYVAAVVNPSDVFFRELLSTKARLAMV